jgi:hypothetical protein
MDLIHVLLYSRRLNKSGAEEVRRRFRTSPNPINPQAGSIW